MSREAFAELGNGEAGGEENKKGAWAGKDEEIAQAASGGGTR